ncbi:MAG TPA: 3-phenylpropionate/cinnamic acid dioxygenase subunit beta [Candidatus Binataceae bacterium]|nr:3-phenylpropionate/cinnamic acid dioxygenase subunit beta [Candidatus Binataceae bacterium]
MSAGTAIRPDTATAERVTPELQQEIEQFLYHESRVLDERRYEEWYDLLAEDLHYYMPTRYNRLKREADKEFSAPNEAAFFDEDKKSIAMRIRRLNTGMAWAEDPPSRTRHMVSNVVIRPRSNGEYEVDCYYLLYRSRLEREVEMFVGMRHDVLRRAATPAGFQVAGRTIILDQAILMARNLSFFF